MARIPVYESQGNLDTRPAKAEKNVNAAAMGGSLFAEMGAGLGEVAGQLEKAHELAETTKAENFTQLKLKELELKRSQDPDLSKENQLKYLNSADEVITQASEMISLQSTRDLFTSQAQRLSGISKINMKKDFMEKTVSQARGNFDVFLDAQYRDFISAESPKAREMAIIRRDHMIEQMADAGFITKEEAAKFKTELPIKWREGYAQNRAYTNPAGFLQENESGYYKGVDPQKLEKLTTAAEKLLKKQKEDFDKEQTEVKRTTENEIASLIMSNAPANEVISRLDQYHEAGAIGEENYRIAKNSLLDNNAGSSDENKLVSLMLQYSKIGTADDPVKAERDFRNSVLIQKADLSEKHFNQLLEWSGAKQIEGFKPKMHGLEKFLSAALKQIPKSSQPFAMMNLFETAVKYMKDEYKPGMIVSRGGRTFEVVRQDDGSIGFKEK